MSQTRWRTTALVAAALVPFVPAIVELAQAGVPDNLLIGDAAVLELRTLEAARGLQLLGPYSRFYWSHPGPAFFYLALPLYEVLGERGFALHLVALLINMVTAVAIVLTARRLRTEAFAWMAAAGVAVIALVAFPELPANPWNPFTPVLPLVLLSLLGVRLALGAWPFAPLFAFIASAIVQTHVGFGPVVAALAAVVAVTWFANRKGSQNGPSIERVPFPVGRVFTARQIQFATAIVLFVCWALPLYEGVTRHPSNLTRLWHFFKGGNPDAPGWGTVFMSLHLPLAVLPVAVAALVYTRRRQDDLLRMVAIVAVAEVAVAIVAVRSVRGALHPYLLYWLAAPAFMTLAAAAAWVDRTRWRTGAAAIVVAATVIGVAFAAPVRAWKLYPAKDAGVERLAHEVEQFIASHSGERPVIRVASGDAWPATAGVLVYLRKRAIPFLVEPGWTFMFGSEHEDPGGEHPVLMIGNRSFCGRAAAERLRLVAEAGVMCVYADTPRALADQRLPPPALRQAVSVVGDVNRLVDGVVPGSGSAWKSARTVVLTPTSSFVTVFVPEGGVGGFFMSADGNDRYAVRCVGAAGSWQIGPERPDDGLVGMTTLRLFSSEMSACSALTITPIAGDGSYSIGEIGFLHPL